MSGVTTYRFARNANPHWPCVELSIIGRPGISIWDRGKSGAIGHVTGFLAPRAVAIAAFARVEAGEASGEITHQPGVHPDLLERCPRCGHQALEHDSYDMRCPDDQDEARLNREDQLP